MPTASPFPGNRKEGDDGAQLMFAKRLRAWRIGNGWSQRQVAIATGLTEQTVLNWEQGRSLPSYDALRRLVEASDISADWWLCLD